MSNHLITLQKAIEMTTLYRNEKENILKEEYQKMDILAIAETFSREAFDTLLAEPGCESLRIYYGMNENLDVHAIIVAVNANDEDILPSGDAINESSSTMLPPPVVVEEGVKCPPHCGASGSPLNPHP